MEELRLAAQAYYKNSSMEFQDMATNFFKSMDTNGDGLVSFDEFTQFLSQHGYSWFTADMFSQLDVNNDRTLDFWEVVTFYYIVKTRALRCDGCRTLLQGLHFTCVACFDSGHNTYDLCATCYGGRNFHHHHTLFLDSYVLLQSKRGTSPTMNMNMAVFQPQTDNHSTWAITQPQNGFNVNPRKYWLTALDVALSAANIGTTLAAGCSIM